MEPHSIFEAPGPKHYDRRTVAHHMVARDRDSEKVRKPKEKRGHRMRIYSSWSSPQ